MFVRTSLKCDGAEVGRVDGVAPARATFQRGGGGRVRVGGCHCHWKMHCSSWLCLLFTLVALVCLVRCFGPNWALRSCRENHCPSHGSSFLHSYFHLALPCYSSFRFAHDDIYPSPNTKTDDPNTCSESLWPAMGATTTTRPFRLSPVCSQPTESKTFGSPKAGKFNVGIGNLPCEIQSYIAVPESVRLVPLETLAT